MINIIVAVDKDGGFGKDGKIPWHFPEDFKNFKETTSGAVCVMGKCTYLDMKEMAEQRGRDITNGILPNRECYVISSTLPDDIVGATRVSDLRQVTDKYPQTQQIFVLGGEKLYIQALSSAQNVYMTIVEDRFNCDRFFPIDVINNHFKLTDGKRIVAENGTQLYFVKYEVKR